MFCWFLFAAVSDLPPHGYRTVHYLISRQQNTGRFWFLASSCCTIHTVFLRRCGVVRTHSHVFASPSSGSLCFGETRGCVFFVLVVFGYSMVVAKADAESFSSSLRTRGPRDRGGVPPPLCPGRRTRRRLRRSGGWVAVNSSSRRRSMCAAGLTHVWERRIRVASKPAHGGFPMDGGAVPPRTEPNAPRGSNRIKTGPNQHGTPPSSSSGAAVVASILASSGYVSAVLGRCFSFSFSDPRPSIRCFDHAE